MVNRLMIFELIVLFHGLDNDIQNKKVDAMGNFDVNSGGKEEFIFSLEVLNELRNLTVHYRLVSRYRTARSLSIVNSLIQRLSLKPKTTNKVIPFYNSRPRKVLYQRCY